MPKQSLKTIPVVVSAGLLGSLKTRFLVGVVYIKIFRSCTKAVVAARN